MGIHNRAVEAYKFQILKDFKEDGRFPNTVEGLADFLTDDEKYNGYIVYHEKDPYNYDTTIWQRLNRLWVLPCCLIAMPFTWLATGQTGVNVHGKFGKWLAKITGL